LIVHDRSAATTRGVHLRTDESPVAKSGAVNSATAKSGAAKSTSRQMASRTWVGLRRAWPYLRYVVGLGLALFALDTLNGHRGELQNAEGYLTHLHWQWVVLAAACEAGSLFAFAVLQGRLLQAGKLRVGLGSLSAITLAATSIAYSLPLGPALASVFAYSQYRRQKATQALAGWVVAASLVVAVVTLAVLASIGLAVAGAEGASYDLVWVTVGVLILALALSMVFLKKRFLARVISASVRLSRRLTGRPRGEIGKEADRIVEQLTVVQLRGGQAAVAAGWGMANWGLDCACLACAFAAVGVAVPWRGLILAYGAGQLAANLPITPGGLGVVEGSITIALVAFGGSESSTVAAVLLYRIFNFWIPLPVGWVAWATLAVRNRREFRRSPLPPESDTTGLPSDQPVPEGPAAALFSEHDPAQAAEHDPAQASGNDPAQASEHDLAQASEHDPAQTAVHEPSLPALVIGQVVAPDGGAMRTQGSQRPKWTQRHPGKSRRRGLVALIVAALVGSIALTGCTAGHASLGTGSSPCYLALPRAADAVHHKGTLVGVLLVLPSDLDHHPAARQELLRRMHGPLHNACLVAYRGKFTSSNVERPIAPGKSGPYAIAVVTPSGNELLATFVLVHSPLRFMHSRIGG
jgi:uncharacterized protein (TIRG00374 family)